MASQGQAVAGQQNRWLELFVVAVAIAAIGITLAWGAMTALSAPSTVVPSRTTTQLLSEPGLLDQRAGERGGVAPVALPKSAPGNPYVNIHVPNRKLVTGGAILRPSMQDHRRIERSFDD